MISYISLLFAKEKQETTMLSSNNTAQLSMAKLLIEI